MIDSGRARRGGFSLIELLVVIGIMATLAALAVGTYNTLRTGQNDKSTESTLSKLNSVMDARYVEVIDRSRNVYKSLNPTEAAKVKAMADGDDELAQVLLAYAHLTVNFPTTKLEAQSDINLGGHVVNHLGVFNTIASGTPEQESAACLYTILTSSNGDVRERTGLSDCHLGRRPGIRRFLESADRFLTVDLLTRPDPRVEQLCLCEYPIYQSGPAGSTGQTLELDEA